MITRAGALYLKNTFQAKASLTMLVALIFLLIQLFTLKLLIFSLIFLIFHYSAVALCNCFDFNKSAIVIDYFWPF